MKLLLHIQLICKHFIDREFDESTTLNNMMKQLTNEGIIQKGLDYTIMVDDKAVVSSRNSTLKECNITNDEHLLILESRFFGQNDNLSINIVMGIPQQNPLEEKKENATIKIDNLSYSQTINSVAKLLAERLNIPFDEIRIIFAGKQVDPYRTLSNCCIQTGSTLYLIRRPTKQPH